MRPIIMAPAFKRFCTTGELSGAITSLKTPMPLVVGLPAVSTFTLMVTGTPCNKPNDSLFATAASAFLAVSNACSFNGSTMAFSSGFFRATRSSTDSTTDVEEKSPIRIPVAWSTALSCQSGVMDLVSLLRRQKSLRSQACIFMYVHVKHVVIEKMIGRPSKS